MGNVEKDLQKRLRLGAVERAILSTASVAGLLAIAVVAPNLLKLLKFVPSNKTAFAYRTQSTLKRLADKGLIVFIEKDGKKFARLTTAGEDAIRLEEKIVSMKTHRPKKWDGKWRMVIFDIPEQRRKVRGRLREIMQEVGFVRLQDSVWIFPYDSEDLVTLLKAELRLGSDVIYAIMDSFLDERSIRTHFKLPPKTD